MVQVREAGNVFLYFGDLDYEGISIYESLAERGKPEYEITLFTTLYEKMLDRSKEMEIDLPQMKEKQNRVDILDFLSAFTVKDAETIQRLLEIGYYIPQEILSRKDF